MFTRMNRCSNITRRTFVGLFFFNDTATTEIYTLSLHDALPISLAHPGLAAHPDVDGVPGVPRLQYPQQAKCRSEEHTSELQSRQYLVCRLLLEKKKFTVSHFHL